jgi:Cu-Zn family superoxide dismutase
MRRESVHLFCFGMGGACALAAAGIVLAASPAAAHKGEETLVVKLHPVSLEGSGVNEKVTLGTVTITAAAGGGVNINVLATGMPQGKHGLHIHRDGSCGIGKVNDKDAPAGAAGPHFDPAKTGKHLGPDGDGMGHSGDLPNLEIGADGTGILETSSTRLNFKDLVGKTVIVHANPDNYTDEPPLGGSGGRIACGMIQEKAMKAAKAKKKK